MQGRSASWFRESEGGPACEREAKAKADARYVSSLLENGGGSTGTFVKAIGKEKPTSCSGRFCAERKLQPSFGMARTPIEEIFKLSSMDVLVYMQKEDSD